MDVHKLVEGRDLILGGVKIPLRERTSWSFGCRCIITCNHGCAFGAAALGDIGKHFPDTDPAYKGASSIRLFGRSGKNRSTRNYM